LDTSHVIISQHSSHGNLHADTAAEEVETNHPSMPSQSHWPLLKNENGTYSIESFVKTETEYVVAKPTWYSQLLELFVCL